MSLYAASPISFLISFSTGGIVALGLGVQDWTVDYCTRMFTEVCEQAFTGRVFHNIPMLGHFSTFVKKSKYKTRPFEKTLQDTFSSDKPLFGGQDVGEASKVKVALTSTTTIDQSPVVMTNYNRPEPPEYCNIPPSTASLDDR
jgi:patatin-like phospholipase/acyl hydrolase